MTPNEYFQKLNSDYLALAQPFEELFWTTFMGTSEDHDGRVAAETALNTFKANPARISELIAQITQLEQEENSPENSALLHGLRGWLQFFEVNAIKSATARDMTGQLLQDDSDLFEKRKKLVLHFANEQGEQVEASTLVLSTNLLSEDSEAVRKSSHDALLELEGFVVRNGLIEAIKHRNAYARAQGYRNFFDYKVNKEERMTPEQLFEILDEFEHQTRDAQMQATDSLIEKHGEHATQPHNLKYYMRGDTTREMDPYLPFSKSLQRWVESFGRMGVQFRDATLTLDLLDRKGKYENGFMHAPQVAWYKNNDWSPAVINFTSNANPDQVGSGNDGLNTLFHEGGHAAHFSNITQNAPCFSQEFPPTSMSYAETQSMFFDSMLSDADWLKLYAKNTKGEAVPDKLIHKSIEATQPFFANGERGILVVPYYEWNIYSLPEEELSAERLIELARHWEKKILGVNCAARPLLSIPHLLDKDAACSYQGYLLANMAVYQTRAWFLREYGYLTDNPHIGNMLAQHYWAPGNSISHNDTLLSLTGEGFTGKYLAAHCNRSVAEAWQEAQTSMASALARIPPPVQPLQAAIQTVHGEELLASNSESDTAMFADFEAEINRRYH
ncbi:MAG: peptidase M3 [Halieaceae bacterium]|jgi:oligoendopeptidase F|nr:peptidase M3 [Halieaceae bacterium]